MTPSCPDRHRNQLRLPRKVADVILDAERNAKPINGEDWHHRGTNVGQTPTGEREGCSGTVLLIAAVTTKAPPELRYHFCDNLGHTAKICRSGGKREDGTDSHSTEQGGSAGDHRSNRQKGYHLNNTGNPNRPYYKNKKCFGCGKKGQNGNDAGGGTIEAMVVREWRWSQVSTATCCPGKCCAKRPTKRLASKNTRYTSELERKHSAFTIGAWICT